MKLTKEEKKYLFSKLEYNKKKTATIKNSELFQILTNEKDETLNREQIDLIFSALENTFKKRLQGSLPDMNTEMFKSIKEKLPDDIILVKFSNLKAKEKKDTKVPTVKDKKEDIIKHLNKLKKEYNPKDSKEKLVSLFKEGHIKTWDGFLNF